MTLFKALTDMQFARNLTKVKLLLLLSFCTLMIFQLAVGFKDFDDYLIVFIFTLFLNDLHIKIRRPQTIHFQEERNKRFVMSVVFLFLFLLPFVIDAFNVSNGTRLNFYKLGFVLWAQVFLLDSFLQYKQTHSKKWLVFANTAVILIIIGAFVN